MIERGLKAPSFEKIETTAKVFRRPVAQLFEVPPTAPLAERVQRSTHGSRVIQASKR